MATGPARTRVRSVLPGNALAIGCVVFTLLAALLTGTEGQADFLPTASECRVHIEAALKQGSFLGDAPRGDQQPTNDVESPSIDTSPESLEESAEGDVGVTSTEEDDLYTETPGDATTQETCAEDVSLSTEQLEEVKTAESDQGTPSEESVESAEDAVPESDQVVSGEDTASEPDGQVMVSEEQVVPPEESGEHEASVDEEPSQEDMPRISTEEDMSIEMTQVATDSIEDEISTEHASADTEETQDEEATSSPENVSEEETDTSLAASLEESANTTSDEEAGAASQEGAASSEETAVPADSEAQSQENLESAEDVPSTEEQPISTTAEDVESEEQGQVSVEEAESSSDAAAQDVTQGEITEDQISTETAEDSASTEDSIAPEEDLSTVSLEDEATQDGSEQEDDTSVFLEDTIPSGEQESLEEGQESLEVGQELDSSQDTASAEPDTSSTDTDSIEEVLHRQRRAVDQEAPEVTMEDATESEETSQDVANKTEASTVDEELDPEIIIPSELRAKEHIGQILRLDAESVEPELLLAKTVDSTLRELKRLYDTAIKPLEMLYKYRDLSNRHFGDPEIFSKPLILFMGPWSGGKSTIINYLMDIEYTSTALRTGAEPSPAYFNILMYGDREEVLDGTQLAADWTFSGLQKFGQGLLDRLRGLKLNNRLLEKVNIVEIPGILEIRKQVERVFPFNDACQWFIDRADVIFLVYDPSKLDVGPETEAILDQLKGREYQTRIILNKADQVRPEELMRVQGTLIWNISPLMSSSEPPVMYSTSLWAVPYEPGAPTRLLHAQEIAFLKDIRDAINKRVENKIASARRFAVRVRNHAKMVDCYLTTYYNHKTLFGNKQKISDDIIEHPQNYHIYEGLSTLTNISRYDLPDPEVYRDFFKLNALYEFQQLSATCTYFRGCPINRLDVAIAYDLPELVGKFKKAAEQVLSKVKS